MTVGSTAKNILLCQITSTKSDHACTALHYCFEMVSGGQRTQSVSQGMVCIPLIIIRYLATIARNRMCCIYFLKDPTVCRPPRGMEGQMGPVLLLRFTDSARPRPALHQYSRRSANYFLTDALLQTFSPFCNNDAATGGFSRDFPSCPITIRGKSRRKIVSIELCL